jgi:hypothetical protein
MKTWIIIGLLTAWMLVWVLGAYFLIGDRPPTWNYGTTPPVPGDSHFTAEPPASGQAAPQQVPPSPDAQEAAP